MTIKYHKISTKVETAQLEEVVEQLQNELEVPKQFCLDYKSLQKFVESIEGLYMSLQEIGEK
uniref:B-box Zinc finger domain-containing protein n=1 Tax=Trepomonas sp. PC1 TaxID=1076344 RepID=A0A146KJA7_9EUKA|eukprot:JAP96547.1 B-box Zinc finger domain-containing protein [Trepomonas sp. PC1]